MLEALRFGEQQGGSATDAVSSFRALEGESSQEFAASDRPGEGGAGSFLCHALTANDRRRRSVTGIGPLALGLATPKAELTIRTCVGAAHLKRIAGLADFPSRCFAPNTRLGPFGEWREEQVALPVTRSIFHPTRWADRAG